MSCASVWQQCGGKGFSGPFCCDVTSICTVSNEYYSQCLPKPVNPVTTVSPPLTTQVVVTTLGPKPTSSPVPCQPGVGSSDQCGDGSFNPYKGATGFINPEYIKAVEGSLKPGSPLAPAVDAFKKISTAIWIDTIENISRIAPALKAASKQASKENPVVIQFVVYDLPGRDCAALASNGEIKRGDLNRYKTDYIDAIRKTLISNADPNVRVSLIIEPDSLPNLATNLQTFPETCGKATPDYEGGVAYALAQLTLPNVYQYIDCAHGGWLGWEDNQSKMIPIFKRVIEAAKSLNPNVKVTGFISNVSNYSPVFAKGIAPAKEQPLQNNNGVLTYQGNACIDESTFTSQLSAKFSKAGLPSRFLIDTSRNGQAGIRTRWGSWCNIKGSGIGPRPEVDPLPAIDAFVWVKPPGESDGVSGPPGAPRLDGFCDPTTSMGVDSLANAPQAGQWFEDEFLMLVKNANPPLF
ncbi:hypothetical protein HDV02_004366 [Globomyces sp. JEL0801]|nr:hypothetical protein HDV02_004366 [Globomyces sp. JEL0801]